MIDRPTTVTQTDCVHLIVLHCLCHLQCGHVCCCHWGTEWLTGIEVAVMPSCVWHHAGCCEPLEWHAQAGWSWAECSCFMLKLLPDAHTQFSYKYAVPLHHHHCWIQWHSLRLRLMLWPSRPSQRPGTWPAVPRPGTWHPMRRPGQVHTFKTNDRPTTGNVTLAYQSANYKRPEFHFKYTVSRNTSGIYCNSVK